MYKNKLLKLLSLLFAIVMMLSSCSMNETTMDALSRSTVNVSQRINEEKILASLKYALIASMNQDLVKQIKDYKLSGSVNVIISFSEDSLVERYNNSNSSLTLKDYLASSTAQKLSETMLERQNKIVAKLQQAGLISDVKYNYSFVMDGVYVSTDYSKLEAICNFDGVGRVTISNTYLPQATVENEVNVYETGIFNSEDVPYTGKQTIVAVLDTGCDYTHSAFTSHQVVDPLYDRDDIAELLPHTAVYNYDNTIEAREVYYGNVTKDKIAFGYDYADKDPDIMPYVEGHGTHVAGIIAGCDDESKINSGSDEITGIRGVAIDAQLAIMKVFSDYTDGAEDGDIIAALEDCVALGVDAINMSLGQSCGFTVETGDTLKQEIYSKIESAGISLVVAASNDHSSAYGSEYGNTNKVENPDSATVGSPATYSAALAVASINGNKDKYMLANGEREIFFVEAFDQNSEEYDFYEMLGINSDGPQTYEYVTIPGYGLEVSFTGLELDGKVALIKRGGDVTFEDKVLNAKRAGAAAVIIYNNVYGDIAMTVGNEIDIPVVSISKDEGDYLASKETGTLYFNADNQAGPFMSDFSSWGPNPDLKLKPDITAHGGNIWSSIPGGGYEKLSGTSMASPNMCGIIVLIRQYVKDTFFDGQSTPETACMVRDMVNRLTMSTATIALNEYGNPYSPRKQGAGIADLVKATTTDAYLWVDGIDKTKLELGDDPTRTGVYEMSVNLTNLSDSAVSYNLGSFIMTEGLSADKKYVSERAYMLSGSSEFSVSNGTLSNNTVTVGPGETAVITAKIILSAADKAYLNESFANGMYVEGYITFDNTVADGVDLNVPYLAFYGDWADAPIFDKDFYLVETEAYNNAIDYDDKIKADYYATTPYGQYYYDYILPLGKYLYDVNPDEAAIPATTEHAALSYYPDTINGLYGVLTGLLRGAKTMQIEIIDTATGKVVWENEKFNCSKAHYRGVEFPYNCEFDLDMLNLETGETFGSNNSHYTVKMTAALDWDGETRNSNDTYEFSFYIDYEAPKVTDAAFRKEYNKSTKEYEYYIDVTVYDNHYAQSIRPVFLYKSENQDGEMELTTATLGSDAIPVRQTNIASFTTVSIEITDLLDDIKNSDTPEGIAFYLDDYALNAGICYVPFPEMEADDLVFDTDKLDEDFTKDANGNYIIDVNQTVDLTQYVMAPNREIVSDYLGMLTWQSDDTSAIVMHNGQIQGLQSGNAATISFESTGVTQPQSISFIVGDSSSADVVQFEKGRFIGYETLYAFNGDISPSEIGRSGSLQYFAGEKASVSMYPGESIKLSYDLLPWNLDTDDVTVSLTYTLKVRDPQTGERVDAMKVSHDAQNRTITVEALTECANADVTLVVKAGRVEKKIPCYIEIKSPFIVENRELVAYKGLGGEVIIPDDKGILYIGDFAFSHFNLDLDKDVPDDYYFDDKKDAIGNNTITSVIIPKGVEKINKYAFYNCTALKSVVLDEGVETIEECAFEGCTSLVEINLENVRIISDRTFFGCKMLGGIKDDGSRAEILLDSISAVGKESFRGCESLRNISLENLRRASPYAFADCKKLTSVNLGKYARLAEYMFYNSGVSGEIQVYSDIVPDYVFAECKNLTKVVFHKDLTYLGDYAFYGCELLSSVKFGDDNEIICEKIGSYAFSNCKKLSSFTLPDCDVVMGDYVFANSNLSNLVFLEKTNITKAGAGLFHNLLSKEFKFQCARNSSYELENGIIYQLDKSGNKVKVVLVSPLAKIIEYTVPDTVYEICDGAFSANKKLSIVKIGENSKLTRIGTGAFADCAVLEKVELPSGKNIVIGDKAFMNCTALTLIDLQSVTNIGDFAFYNSAISGTAQLVHDGVVIGGYAFTNVPNLIGVVLGKNAVVGDYAFYNVNDNSSTEPYYSYSLTSVTTVSGAQNITIGNFAFYGACMLEELDISNVSGKLGDYAFGLCESVEEVDLSNITEIGEGSFMMCVKLKTVSNTQNIVKIGEGAFRTYFEATEDGESFVIPDGLTMALEKIDISKVQTIGDYAFIGTSLKYVDLSGVKNTTDEQGNVVLGVGVGAFFMNKELVTVVFGEALTHIGDLAFYECPALQLKENDLVNVESIGVRAFSNVNLPSTLNLASAKEIGAQAFAMNHELAVAAMLKSVNAPKLTTIGYEAFSNNLYLTNFNAPSIEDIGSFAFSYTRVNKLQVSDKFNPTQASPMGYASQFAGFYVLEGETENYNYANDTFVLDDGVLYLVMENGYYVLQCYPEAKTDEAYVVLENTGRIEYYAVFNNTYLEEVTLPKTLRTIGDFAFADCEQLSKVIFRSYYAPTLEGTITADEITKEVVKENYDEENFLKLYKYDYYYRFEENKISFYYRNKFDYCNFGAIATKEASDITYVIPQNNDTTDDKGKALNRGYDNLLYKAFFKESEEDSGIVDLAQYSIAFIDAVKALPETVTRFDKKLISDVVTAYNALMTNGQSQMSAVSDELVEKYLLAVKEYNVDRVEYAISQLFEMDNTAYSYNAVRVATQAYQQLTSEEQALIMNAQTLNEKQQQLKTAMGVDQLDFSKEFSDYVIQQPVDEPDGNDTFLTVIISVGVVLLVAVGAVVTFFLVKKQRKQKDEG